MPISGSIIIKKEEKNKEEVYIIKTDGNGLEILNFIKENKNPESIDNLILLAMNYLSEYDILFPTHTSVSFHVKPFEGNEDWTKYGSHYGYYNGECWEHNFEDKVNL